MSVINLDVLNNIGFREWDGTRWREVSRPRVYRVIGGSSDGQAWPASECPACSGHAPQYAGSHAYSSYRLAVDDGEYKFDGEHWRWLGDPQNVANDS